MECPSCGALLASGVTECNECAAVSREESVDASAALVESSEIPEEQAPSRLIEFPGTSRTTVPQWRKELSERVREVQEKRAREETLELTLAKNSRLDSSEPTPQLELLTQAESTPINPLVAAALRRIERAHETGAYIGRPSSANGATAVAYAEPFEVHGNGSKGSARAVDSNNGADGPEAKQPDKVHNLVVVPSPAVKENSEAAPKPKPKRMIAGDINDPALNYLDSIPTAVRVEGTRHRRASALPRLVSALLDLIVIGVLCAPFAGALELTNTNWQDPRVWIFLAGVFSAVGFLYFTVSTALTGRTLGLRLLSLRIVDARTGLIPTGTQSAGRALIYLASLSILGITSLFALMNSEGLTAHDRITRTAVVQG